MAYPSIATLTGSVKYSDGITLFDGYALLVLAFPAGYVSASIANQLIPQPIANPIKVRIQNGVYDGSARIYQNGSIEPPNTKYAAYFFDNNDQQLGVTALFTIASSPYTITVPSMTIPTATSTVPSVTVPGATAALPTTGLGFNGQLIALNGTGEHDIVLQDSSAPTGQRNVRWRKIGANSYLETVNDALSTVDFGHFGMFGATGNVWVGDSSGHTPTDDATNAVQIQGPAKVFGNLLTSGSFSPASIAVTGNETVGGALGVTGATTLTTLASGSQTITGNETISGTLGVTGATTLAATTTTTLASGTQTITGNETISGTLGVTGATTLTTLASGTHTLTGNETISGTLGVTGVTTLTGGVASSLLLNGSGSGSATIQVASAAGSPNPLQLPTSTGTSGQWLVTDGGNPQQLSFVSTPPSTLPHSSAYSSALQTILNNTQTPLTFDTNLEDVGGIHSTSVNTSRFTCQKAGWYRATGQVQFNTIADGVVVNNHIWKNGADTTPQYIASQTTGASAAVAIIATAELRLAVNDYIEFSVAQISGGSINTIAGRCSGTITMVCL